MDELELEVQKILIAKLKKLIEQHQQCLASEIASECKAYNEDWCMRGLVPSIQKQYDDFIEDAIIKLATAETEILLYNREKE